MSRLQAVLRWILGLTVARAGQERGRVRVLGCLDIRSVHCAGGCIKNAALCKEANMDAWTNAPRSLE